ncbi:MAG: FliM/FliN family flagellar motor switch protein [Acidimicrobiales bacterium]
MPDVVAAEEAAENLRQYELYDFQRHEAMERNRLRRLLPVLEVAAHRATQALTGLLRTPTKVEIGALNQERWETYAASLPDPTYLAVGAISPLGGRVSLHIPSSLVQALVELRLGGSVSSVALERQISDIDMRLVAEVAETLLAEVFKAVSVIVPLAKGPLQASSSPSLVQMSDSSEVYLLIGLKFTFEDKVVFDATAGLPLQVPLTLVDALERIDRPDIRGEGAQDTAVLERLLEAPLAVSVSFREVVLSADEILSLSIGDSISLQQPEAATLCLNVEGIHFCDVVPTTSGKHLACMVVETKTKESK